MSKRKLNIRQQRRITDKGQNKPQDPTAHNQKSLGEKQQGLVITNFGKRVLVEHTNGDLINCSVRQHLGKLVAGDTVEWQADIESNSGIVVHANERTRELSRPGFRSQTRMVAANIDIIAIVVAIEPGVHTDMIDRYLVAVYQLDLQAILIVNKIDLISSDEHWELITALIQPYIDMGVPMFAVSSENRAGIEELELSLIDKKIVFVGTSGAGKSSLVNTLIPDLGIKTNQLSESTGLGRHTTSNSVLYHFPKGGDLIDSPGVRQFTPAKCDLQTLEQSYTDFMPFLGQCKFNNCTHSIEPFCAIKKAVEEDEIYLERYQSFQRMREELVT